MHRTQILLEDWQYESLKAEADRRGRSLAGVVREAVAAYLTEDAAEAWGELSAIAGIGDDPTGTGRDHDRLLYGRDEG
jgi:hypothetical protein